MRVVTCVALLALAGGGAPLAIEGQAPPVGRPLAGQRRPNAVRPAAPNDPAPMGPQQVQELIDAYALVEAERMLQMTDQQYAQFVAKATRLHRIRRQAILERQRALRELAAIVTAPGAPREEAVAEKLKALDEASERLGVAVRQALADVDSVLTVVQRARYRVLEEQLERRKIELLNRALGARDPRTPDGRGAPSRGPGGEGS